jgi:outer membrane beta-barrel protein
MKKLVLGLAFLGLLALLPSVSFAQLSGGIAVIKPRAIVKSKRLEISVLQGWNPSNPFFTYLPVEGRIGFHFSEGFGIELSGGYNPPYGSDPATKYTGPLKTSLSTDLQNDPLFVGVKVFEQQVFHASLALMIEPVFGKVRLAGLNTILYWDIYLYFGVGITGVYDQEVTGEKNSDDKFNPLQIRPTLSFGLGNRFWFNRHIALKIDLRESLFQKQAKNSIGQGGLAQYLTLSVGLSFTI